MLLLATIIAAGDPTTRIAVLTVTPSVVVKATRTRGEAVGGDEMSGGSSRGRGMTGMTGSSPDGEEEEAAASVMAAPNTTNGGIAIIIMAAAIEGMTVAGAMRRAMAAAAAAGRPRGPRRRSTVISLDAVAVSAALAVPETGGVQEDGFLPVLVVHLRRCRPSRHRYRQHRCS